jgi:hypothetical protein
MIVEQLVCPRILAAICDEPIDRQLNGLAGAIMQVLMTSKLPREQREGLLRGMAECLIKEMAHFDALNAEQRKDRLIALSEEMPMYEPPAGKA